MRNITDQEIVSVLDSIKEVLKTKNKKYGNAALEPLNVFNKCNASNSIAVRLDDKLSRIKNSDTLRKNDMFDLMGYLFLYLLTVDQNIDNEKTFDEKVDWIAEQVHGIITKDSVMVLDYLTYGETCQTSFFFKEKTYEPSVDNVRFTIDHIIRDFYLDCNETIFDWKVNALYQLIALLTVNFIYNNILEFSELID